MQESGAESEDRRDLKRCMSAGEKWRMWVMAGTCRLGCRWDRRVLRRGDWWIGV